LLKKHSVQGFADMIDSMTSLQVAAMLAIRHDTTGVIDFTPDKDIGSRRR